MDKTLLFHGQKFAISEFSGHIEYDFLKEDHKNNFHTKNREDSQQRLEVIGQNLSKLSILAKKWPSMDQISPYQNFPSIQSRIFLKRTIRTTSIPKIRKIHSGVWKLYAQNSKIGLKWTKLCYSMAKNSPYQNFPGIQSMIFSKRNIRTFDPQNVKKWSKFGHFWPKQPLLSVFHLYLPNAAINF